MVPVVVINGPVGVGKSTVAREVSVILERRGIPHTLVDLDELTYTFPRPPDDPFGEELALRNLRAVWGNARQAGARNLILVRVVERPDPFVEAVEQIVEGADVVLVRLTAGSQVLQARTEGRERGSLAGWHRERALELAEQLADQPADLVIDTGGRDVHEVAAQVADEIDWDRRPAGGIPPATGADPHP